MSLRSSAKLSVRVFVLVVLASWLSPAHSATDTWNGGGGDNNFRTPANWVGGSTRPRAIFWPSTAECA